MKTIKKNEFDSAKHSTYPDDYKKKQAVLPAEKPAEKPAETPAPTLALTTPVDLPSVGPEAIIGGIADSSALAYGTYAYAALRRALRNMITRR